MNLHRENLLFLLATFYGGQHPPRCHCEECEWRRKQAITSAINESLARQAREGNDDEN